MAPVNRFIQALTLLVWASLTFAWALAGARGASKEVPPLLKPWESWVLWGEDHRECPLNFDDPSKHLCFWPSELQFQVQADGGEFRFRVKVFKASYVPLPGSEKQWPQEVKSAGAGAMPVLNQKGQPVVYLEAGEHELSGRFFWSTLPGSVKLPKEIGVLALTLNGSPVNVPSWDASGTLWLQREMGSSEVTQNFLSKKAYALLEDGEPLWYSTKVELVVSGKSREEVLGNILPEGWKVTSVKSALPVAIDNAGNLKAQVRTGKWTIDVQAVKLTSPAEIGFTKGTTPVSEDIYLAFKAAPELRTIDLEGIPSIDVSQLTFPEEWRSLPVYRWETATSFRIEERMRGMGGQRPPGLTVERQLWLDEKGKGITFLDQINGSAQEIWRLDVLPGQKLGAVRRNGEGQLITLNPQTGAAGVELRHREVNLQAIGQITDRKNIAATGWDADVEKVDVKLNLPPGWRLFSVAGVDYVTGDWVTAWSLLDLFLVLLFTLAVYRLWGVPLAVLAFVTLVISYHEPEAPRVLWLLLLVPLGLQRVASGKGWGPRLVTVSKYAVLVILICMLFPFLVGQIRKGLYPQLEFETSASQFVRYEEQTADKEARVTAAAAAPVAKRGSYGILSSGSFSKGEKLFDLDPKARVQTGPAIPQWNWRTVTYGWNGPVAKSQQIHFYFIPGWLERVIMALRVVLSVVLLGLLMTVAGRKRRPRPDSAGSGVQAAAAVVALLLASFGSAAAQGVPDETMLNTLRERLLAAPESTAATADVPLVSLKIDETHRVQIEAEVHTAGLTALPLPAKLTGWEAHSVTVDGAPQVAVQRKDGYLWIALPGGIHRVTVKGTLVANMTDWEWAFLLKPHRVTVEAPGWKISGVSPDGIPEQQLFLTREQRTETLGGEYDRVETQSIVRVERELELGLTWQVRTRVQRLTPVGKAISMRIPLLGGENVISSDVIVDSGDVEVRLGAQQKSFEWVSELSQDKVISLVSRADDPWVEQWSLVASPVWNVQLSGLAPIFTPSAEQLVPVWHPWPGESAALTIQRPEAQEGATLTVQSTTYSVEVGQRQRTNKLLFIVECSLGEDFNVTLPEGAEVLNLHVDGQASPVRRNGEKLVIPLRAGKHNVAVDFREERSLGFHTVGSTIGLPAESANTQVELEVPRSRWILYTYGPIMGPAVLYWGVLLAAILTGLALSRVPGTPLKTYEWILLSIGMVELVNVHVAFVVIVVGWLLLLGWRGRDEVGKLPAWGFNLFQLLLIGLTGASVLIFLMIALQGLLGTPSMMIDGNGSSAYTLKWYQASSGTVLPQPGVYTVSIWWYRLLMLLWALWLASALVRWLAWGWKQFSKDGVFRKFGSEDVPPPIPPQQTGE